MTAILAFIGTFASTVGGSAMTGQQIFSLWREIKGLLLSAADSEKYFDKASEEGERLSQVARCGWRLREVRLRGNRQGRWSGIGTGSILGLACGEEKGLANKVMKPTPGGRISRSGLSSRRQTSGLLT